MKTAFRMPADERSIPMIPPIYKAKEERYDNMQYRFVGKSGLKFPAVSLGFWHNFGTIGKYENMRAICRTAFDNGVTHFDLANNYGPPYGEAERNFGRHMDVDWKPHRDELFISTKAGDRKSTRLNSSHASKSRMPSSA